MAWTNLLIDTDAEHAEALSESLLQAGALSVSIEDALAGTPEEIPQFGEPGSLVTPAQPGWQKSRIQALLDSGTHPASEIPDLVAICSKMSGLNELPTWQTVNLEEENWVALTQAQFEPICISNRLWIVPSWHEAPNPDAINLILDPGMAFGTGSHPTTRLCLEWLETVVGTGDSVLDYGCGSGILAIAAARLGAEQVVGVDIDPQAVSTARSNARANRVEAEFNDSIQPLEGVFDCVVANILANPLRVLAPAICSHIRPDGFLALSGILTEQTDEIIAVYAPYLPLEVFARREGWVCLAGKKPRSISDSTK